MLLCKDKNFKANHNTNYVNIFLKDDVCYYAKIRILKQITTTGLKEPQKFEMFVIMQR